MFIRDMKDRESMKRVISAFIVLLLVGVLLLSNISSQPVLTVNVSGTTNVEMCVQYDYDITIQNPSATETATNAVAVATIPAGFAIIDAGGGSVIGQQITWSIGTLDPLETWNTTITLEVTCTAVSGQILVNVTYDGGSSQGSIYLSVQPGAVTITKTPSVIHASIGDTVTWTITIESTGLGPIRNVVVQDTLGAGLTYISSSPSGNNVGQTTTWDSTHILALALMAPGATVTITMDARVDACSNLENDAQASWGCDGTPCETETAQASVQLILKEPEISYTLPDFQVPYCSSDTEFTISITNDGTGTAHNFYLYVDFGSLSVVNVTSPLGASYNTAEKKFEIGDIDPGTVDLTFTLSSSDWCSASSGTSLFKPEYTDDCGNVFSPPWQLSSYSITNIPSLSVSKTGAPATIYLGESITYSITATYSGSTSCLLGSGASNITVVDTIPSGFTITDAGGGTVSPLGDTITWIVDPSIGLNTSITLQSPGYDEDSASVTASFSPHIWKVLSFNGVYRCELCGMEDLFRKARDMNIEFSEDRDKCCKPYDLIDALEKEIVERGLENDSRYENVLQLLEYSFQCCDNASETYSSGNYIESYRWSIKKCSSLREAIEFMIEILS